MIYVKHKTLKNLLQTLFPQSNETQLGKHLTIKLPNKVG